MTCDQSYEKLFIKCCIFWGFRGELLGIVRLPVAVAVAGRGWGWGAPPTSLDTFNSLGGRGGRFPDTGVNDRVLVHDSSLRGDVFL